MARSGLDRGICSAKRRLSRAPSGEAACRFGSWSRITRSANDVLTTGLRPRDEVAPASRRAARDRQREYERRGSAHHVAEQQAPASRIPTPQRSVGFLHSAAPAACCPTRRISRPARGMELRPCDRSAHTRTRAYELAFGAHTQTSSVQWYRLALH